MCNTWLVGKILPSSAVVIVITVTEQIFALTTCTISMWWLQIEWTCVHAHSRFSSKKKLNYTSKTIKFLCEQNRRQKEKNSMRRLMRLCNTHARTHNTVFGAKAILTHLMNDLCAFSLRNTCALCSFANTKTKTKKTECTHFSFVASIFPRWLTV